MQNTLCKFRAEYTEGGTEETYKTDLKECNSINDLTTKNKIIEQLEFLHSMRMNIIKNYSTNCTVEQFIQAVNDRLLTCYQIK